MWYRSLIRARAWLVVVFLVAGGCFGPSVPDCVFACGAGAACPADMSCSGEGFCVADVTRSCLGLVPAVDAAPGAADAMGTSDGAPGTPDAPAELPPDALPLPPDAPLPLPPDAALPLPPDAPLAPDAFVPPPPDAAPGCVAETVTVDPYPDGSANIMDVRLDLHDGRAHVSYVSRPLADLHPRLDHAIRALDGGAWTREPISPDAQDFLLGQAIAPNGAVHVSYMDVTARVSYARRGASGWTLSPIDFLALRGSSSLVVDGDGVVHVVYHPGDWLFTHAVRRPGSMAWDLDTIDERGAGIGRQSALAWTSGGELMAAYFSDDLGLVVSVRSSDSGEWKPLPFASEAGDGRYPALVVDGAGTAHILHAATWGAAYVTINASGAADEVPMQLGPVGTYGSLVVEPGGRVHATYLDFGRGELRYATRAPSDESFKTTLLAPVGPIAGRSALARAPDGRLFLAYPDMTTGHVRLRTICP